ncbi:MAG: CaiB/BaiF CoA transferase family protein [Pseudomonadales bacterium]
MKPLAGVTILEFSTMITASFAAMMMAEQGARVIKVEPIEAGDPMRYIGAAKGGISSLFANCNRGKESIKVNLKEEAGQKLVRQLAADVDVVIHNFRPGVMDKLGLGSEALREANSKLIYMAISGFGHEGPMKNAPAYDPVIQAHTGMTHAQGFVAGAGEHTFIRNLMCDKVTAYTACQAVTSALYLREKTGEGQHIDLSMLDSGLFFLFPDSYMDHTLLDDDVTPGPYLPDLLYQLTLTQDGAITISAATDAQRFGVLKALGKEQLLEDERFNSLEALMRNMEAYRAELAEAFLTFSTDDILKRLGENDVPCARCLSFDEVLAQPQLAANDSLQQVEHPLMGKMRYLRAPARFGGEPLEPASPSPAHGQHTASVLSAFGYDERDLEELRTAGVIG